MCFPFLGTAKTAYLKPSAAADTNNFLTTWESLSDALTKPLRIVKNAINIKNLRRVCKNVSAAPTEVRGTLGKLVTSRKNNPPESPMNVSTEGAAG